MQSGRADAAELTPYELRNLVAHLEAAGQENTLHQLLALETDAGTNFWFEKKDQGDPGGYVTDAELRESEEWPSLVEGEWFSKKLAALVPRLDKELLPDLEGVAGSIPSLERLPLLVALVDTFRPSPQRLHDCWANARAALDGVKRSGILKALATLAPVVDTVGGSTGTRDSAASVHLVARWHP